MDAILQDASRTYTIIPKHQFMCMESVRARLYCNISWSLLGLGACSSPERGGTAEKVSEETLQEASKAAKKALDIGDELINGPKFLREEGSPDSGNNDETAGHGQTTEAEEASERQEWERILREKSQEWRDAEVTDATESKPADLPLSPLWAAYHRAESARALGLVAHCYAAAGAAVTAEGLFQAALDASSAYPAGRSLTAREGGGGGPVAGRGVSSSSPHLGLIARDVRLWYALLCDDWEKREGDAERLRATARKIEEEGVLKGLARGEDEAIVSVSGLESSLWLLSPLDFERQRD